MPRPRVCSECGASIAGRAAQARTCSEKCRKRRSKRLSDANRGGPKHDPEHIRTVREVVRGERDDVLDRTVQEELRPVVREAITEDVLRAIEEFVALTPAVVKAIAEDLNSDDATIRQKAYALVARYTLGHPALVPDDVSESKALTVHFNLPRPDGSEPDAVEAAVEAQATEYKTCDMCGEEKAETAFIAGSDRCADCYAKQRERALALTSKQEDVPDG